jgi:hypothetical protein
MPTTARRSGTGSEGWEPRRFYRRAPIPLAEPVRRVPDLVASGKSAFIASLLWTSDTCGACSRPTSSTTSAGGHISHWGWIVRRPGGLKNHRWGRSFRSPRSVDSTIIMKVGRPEGRPESPSPTVRDASAGQTGQMSLREPQMTSLNSNLPCTPPEAYVFKLEVEVRHPPLDSEDGLV